MAEDAPIGFGGALTTWCTAWTLERRDGVTLGFVAHDRDLVTDALTYRAAPALAPTAVALSDGLEHDNAEVEGALTDDGLAEEDLAAGRWNGAALEIARIDWRAPEAARHVLMRGTFGEIAREGTAFRAEMLGATQRLEEPVAPATSPTCRAALGDAHCKLPRRALACETAVATVDGAVVTVGDGVDGALYAWGSLRFLDGANAGLTRDIVAGEGAELHLADAPAFAPRPGARAKLTEGCDKRFATCRDRFANAINFRGEPHLPGNDLLTRYPGG